MSFHCLRLTPSASFSCMQPQTHPCSDKCYSLPKDGTGNEAKLVLWEAFHDWGIYHWLLRHLGHVFIHSHMFLEAISHSYSHYAVRTSLCNLIHPLSFPISSFLSVCFIFFIDTMPSLNYVLLRPFMLLILSFLRRRAII